MKEKYNNRWYDKYPDLAKSIKKLRGLKKHKRHEIIQSISKLITKRYPRLIDKYIMHYSIADNRRCYDSDHYFSLVFNTLKYANEDLINDIILYLKKKL